MICYHAKCIDRQLVTAFIEKLLDSDKIYVDIAFSLLWKDHAEVCIDIKTRSSVIKERIKKVLKNELIAPGINLIKSGKNECDFDRFKMKKGEERWKTLDHNGPFFKHLLEPYERLGIKLIYEGKPYDLTDEEEEVIVLYAKRLITEEKSTKKFINSKDPLVSKQFNANYFNDLKTYLTPSHKKIFTNFSKIDFTSFVERIKHIKEEKEKEKEKMREIKKNGKEVDKKQIEIAKKKDRINKLEKKLNYSYAYVNGIKKNVRNSAVEMMGLFVGSGDNMTNKGKIKPKYYPEEVTINISKGKIPPLIKGHKWKEVVNDKTGNWTAKYIDKITGKNKYILLSETGDLLKFEKARKLNKNIHVIDKKINKLLKSSLVKDNQIGCCLYLIKEYGLRIGNEGEDDKVCKTEKVVGASTLLKKNVKCEKDGKEFRVILDFRGKDSVLYNNTLIVDELFYNHIVTFSKHKQEQLFDQISSNDVNKYLKSIDKDFSAKVFRTRLASHIMYEGLKKLNYDEDVKDDEKLADFNQVNREVALKLNHKKGIEEKTQLKIKEEEDIIKQLEKDMKLEKDKKKQAKMMSTIADKKAKWYEKKENIGIAKETSKKNYIDPRIVKAWSEKVNLGGCKDEDEDEDKDKEDDDEMANSCVDKIYSKEQLKHFRWAIEDENFDESWDYQETDLECINEELEPEVDKQNADKPKADKPNADKPNADKPKADKPKADKPKADKPKADKPKKSLSKKMIKECIEKVSKDKKVDIDIVKKEFEKIKKYFK
jgi:DNA topoisomerase-1